MCDNVNSNITTRQHGYSYYPYRQSIYLSDDQLSCLVEWLFQMIGSCEILPSTFRENIAGRVDISCYLDPLDPKWSAKHYSNGRIKLYFRHSRSLLLFKIAWVDR